MRSRRFFAQDAQRNTELQFQGPAESGDPPVATASPERVLNSDAFPRYFETARQPANDGGTCDSKTDAKVTGVVESAYQTLKRIIGLPGSRMPSVATTAAIRCRLSWNAS